MVPPARLKTPPSGTAAVDSAASSPGFLGLDLAWSERNPSGLALARLRAGGLHITETDTLTTDGEITRWIASRTRLQDGPVLIAIDAPIIAPNPPGTSREADRLMTRLFGRFHAGAYPANRERSARPISLRKTLETMGFSPDPKLPVEGSVRRLLEFYPHSSMVALLGRSRIIKYKKGPVAERRRGLGCLQSAVSSLARLEPSLHSSPALDALLGSDPFGLAGRSLKRLEDLLDSVVLAYLAAYYWCWGLERCQILGDVEGGYIVTVRTNVLQAGVKNVGAISKRLRRT